MDQTSLSPLALSAKAAAEQVAMECNEAGEIAEVARQTLLEATRDFADAASRLPQCVADVMQGIVAGVRSSRAVLVATATESAVRTAHEAGAGILSVTAQAMDAVERASGEWTADSSELTRAALSGALAAVDDHCQGECVRQWLVTERPLFAKVIAELDRRAVSPPQASRRPPPVASA